MSIETRIAGPAAYYLAGTADGKRPGRFYVNTGNISEKPLYETAALALHEGAHILNTYHTKEIYMILRCLLDSYTGTSSSVISRT